MRNYEVTFIVDPVLSGDEIKSTAQSYVKMIKDAGATIVHDGEMGLRQLAYPINRRTTGIYYTTEFEVVNGEMIAKMELAMRRDERIMRFLTVSLDKYGVKYNADKRAGLIGTKKKKETKEEPTDKKPAAKAAAAPKKVVKETRKVVTPAPVKVEKVVKAEAVVTETVVAPVTKVAASGEEELDELEEDDERVLLGPLSAHAFCRDFGCSFLGCAKAEVRECHGNS